jgi:hypothetical protein
MTAATIHEAGERLVLCGLDIRWRLPTNAEHVVRRAADPQYRAPNADGMVSRSARSSGLR